MSDLKANLEAIQKTIKQTLESLGDTNRNVHLIAVSKGQSIEKIQEAYQLGIRDFGESYIQEWMEKKEQLKNLPDIRWHIIGHLQSNKVKYLKNDVYCLHSINRVSLVEVLERHALKNERKEKLRILVELQVDPHDTNKQGAPLDEAKKVCEMIHKTTCLEWQGFMGMGPAQTNPDVLLELYQKFINQANLLWQEYRLSTMPETPPIISLGMSDDYEIALRAGSNMIRIGTALFGERAH